MLPIRFPLLTWNPPCCDRICPPHSQVARKLNSQFPSPCSYTPSSQNPDPPGFPRSKYTLIRTTSRIWLTRSSTLHIFHSAHSSEWCLGGKPYPRRQRVRPSPPLYLCYCLDAAHLFLIIFLLKAPNGDGTGPAKKVHDWAPHPVYVYVYAYTVNIFISR